MTGITSRGGSGSLCGHRKIRKHRLRGDVQASESIISLGYRHQGALHGGIACLLGLFWFGNRILMITSSRPSESLRAQDWSATDAQSYQGQPRDSKAKVRHKFASNARSSAKGNMKQPCWAAMRSFIRSGSTGRARGCIIFGGLSNSLSHIRLLHSLQAPSLRREAWRESHHPVRPSFSIALSQRRRDVTVHTTGRGSWQVAGQWHEHLSFGGTGSSPRQTSMAKNTAAQNDFAKSSSPCGRRSAGALPASPLDPCPAHRCPANALCA